MGNVEMWRSLAPLLAAFDDLGRDGDLAAIKVDGEREHSRFTVLLHGKSFVNASYRRDGDDLAALLEEAIRYGHARRPAPEADRRPTLLSRFLARFARAPHHSGDEGIGAENIERWGALAPHLAGFEQLGRDGGVVLLCLRGERNARPFTVALIGKRFAEARYECDGDDLALLLEDAIRHGSNHDQRRADT